jgi:glycosyltransferase involved in cell wall biosynthesis
MYKTVSIITPCYNGEKYLPRYFESLLAQTYPTVELIFVNDGSTDRTEEMALEYGEKLKARGYQFRYIYQENAGQSAAINQGLKVFSGDYLNWTDADDFLSADSIEKRVEYLETHSEAGLVIGATALVDDIDYQQLDLLKENSGASYGSRELIEKYLKGTFIIPCCSTMVRSSMFREAMNSPIHIEEVREIGQNYQLFIPIIFKYPVRYIPDILAYCVVHQDSHSHSRKSFEQKLHIQDVATQTLNSISDRLNVNENERIWFKSKITEYDCKARLEIHQHHRRKDQLRPLVKKMKQLGCYDSTARKMVLKIQYPFVKCVADFVWKRKKK